MKRLQFLGDNSSSSAGMNLEPDFSMLKTLYGRHREMEQLVSIYNSVSSDQGLALSTQVVLVHGSTGTGKTALCRFFEKKVSPVYVEGKFDQLSNEPYCAFSQAFTKLSDLMAEKEGGELAKIQESFLSEEDPEIEALSRKLSNMPETGDAASNPDDLMTDASFTREKPSSLARRAISLSLKATSAPSMRPGTCPPVITEQETKRKISRDPLSRCEKSFMSSQSTSVDSISRFGKSLVSHQSMTETVDTKGRISSIVPGMARLVPSNIVVPSHSIDRIRHSFRSFLRAICTPTKPVVLCLRGLQWADDPSLQLLQYLSRDTKCHGLIIIGCYRDDEVLHPRLRRTLSSLKRYGNVTTLPIGNLKQPDLHHMIADVTLTANDLSKSAELSEVVFEKTHGNPYFTIEFLRMLAREQYLWLNYASNQFEFDVTKIRSETYVAENVAELITDKLRALPETAQNALRVGACLGAHCDLDVIAAIVEMTFAETKFCLRGAVKERLIEMNEIDSFRWAHDKVQQAAYELLPDLIERPAFHLKVGKVLKQLAESSDKEWTLFLAAEHLNRAVGLISDDRDKMDLILLNKRAAELASEKSALVPASEFLVASLDLMGDSDSRWKVHYDLSMQVCIQLADIECILGRFGTCEELIRQVLQNARSLEEKIPAYFSQFESFTAQGNVMEAVNLGIKTLELLGEPMRRKPNKLQVYLELASVRRILKGITNDQILQLPQMENARTIAAMRMMSKTTRLAWLTGQKELAVFLCLRILKRTCRHGQTWASAHAFAGLGALCGDSLDCSAASRYGDLALAMVEKHENHAARPLLLYLIFIHHLKNPLQQCLDPMISAYKTGMNSGDIDVAHECVANYVAIYVIVGLPLASIEDDAQKFVEQLSSYNRRLSLWLLRIHWQSILCFMGDYASSPVTLTGRAMDQEVATNELTVTNQLATLRAMWTMRMILGYHFGDFELAEEMGRLLADSGLNKGHFSACAQYGYMALTKLALARNAPLRRQNVLVRDANRLMAVMSAMLKAKNVNVYHLFQLCVAESATLHPSKDINDVMSLYRKAIATACRSGILHDAAIANERAGLFVLHRGDPDGAKLYFERAVELYSYWGAAAKVSQIQSDYKLSEEFVDQRHLTEGFLARKKFSTEEANKHKTVFLNPS